MQELEALFKILGDKNRIRIVKLLEKRKMCVCELAGIIGIAQPSVSRHLKKMKAVGLIAEEQDSFWTNYALSRPVDGCSARLLAFIKTRLNDDQVIVRDRRRAGRINRDVICCKPEKKKGGRHGSGKRFEKRK